MVEEDWLWEPFGKTEKSNLVKMFGTGAVQTAPEPTDQFVQLS